MALFRTKLAEVDPFVRPVVEPVMKRLTLVVVWMLVLRRR
jgi:hypothetical protein